jgi:aspartyl/asparaginyl beta-hydroxylase (cupin superfamily)
MQTPSSHPIDAQIRRLMAGVEQARVQKRALEMAQMLAEAERLAPLHPLVQLEKARQNLYLGDVPKAIAQLQDVLKTDPSVLDGWMTLAQAYRIRGLLEDELNALNKALVIDPSHPLILLQKAEVLDLLGRSKAAAKLYGNALKTIPAQQKLPPAIEAQVAIAKRRVSEGADELARFLESTFLRRGVIKGSSGQKRFERGLERFLGRQVIYTPNPTFFLLPFLTNREYYEREEFPWIERLEAATNDIRSECIHVLTTPEKGLEPYVAYPDGLPLHQWAELNRSRRWSAAFLWKEGAEISENLERCPKTSAVLRSIETRVEIPNRGPTAFFSILDAKTTIPAHTGVTNTRLTVHLPLIVPPGGCAFRVGGETRLWQEGQAWVFDDSIEHEAHNPTELPRAILIFDVWHPELSVPERQLVREFMIAINDYYMSEGVGVQWAL